MTDRAFVPNEEQAMLRESALGWVRENAPISDLRKLRTDNLETGFDPDLFAEMAEMGWTGILVPEDHGGFGFGHASMGLVAEQMGRNLVASPLIGSAVAATDALALFGTEEQKAEWLPRLLSGEIHAAIALEETIAHNPAGVALTACREGDGWILEGHKQPVFDFGKAGLVIVVARTSGAPGDAEGVTLFLCPGDAGGISARRLTQVDSRGAWALAFDGCALGAGSILGEVDKGLPALETVLDRARAVLAAEMIGSTTQAFETTIEYLKTRVQFDQPIGSFQALQHRAAELLSEIELARSAVWAALAAIDAGDDDVPQLTSLAKALAGKAFRRAAQEMVQLHGGIGMTDEHDSGLYLKRAHVTDMTFGSVAFHRDRYARLAGI
ncbi:MAG: acyl-CoA dehydrogenase family protein [Novosphingobium sp.]|nr:acyl-CoA dehydrogenase family protein [Novosphingobium sp.]